MHDLVTWLLAQLDEDEQRAHAAAEPFVHGDRTGMDGLHPQILSYVRQWVPARVLAEVDAKRRIIELYSGTAQYPDFSGGYDSAAEDAIKLLAVPYADRPGYRDEWRP